MQARLHRLAHARTQRRFFNQTQTGPTICIITRQEYNGAGITQISRRDWLICCVIHRPAAADWSDHAGCPLLSPQTQSFTWTAEGSMFVCVWVISHRDEVVT